MEIFLEQLCFVGLLLYLQIYSHLYLRQSLMMLWYHYST